MLRTIKNKVAKMEETLGRKRGIMALIFAEPGETSEQAKERDFREHPEDRDCECFIIVHSAASPPPAGGPPVPPAREVEEGKPLPPPGKPLQITK